MDMERQKSEMGKRINLNVSQFMPGLSIDNVIFGFHDNQLKVLLSGIPEPGATGCCPEGIF